MKLGELKGDAAFEAMGRLLAPLTEIGTDNEVAALAKSGAKIGEIAALLLKTHRGAIKEILAALAGKPADAYEVTLPGLLSALSDLLNDRELQTLFTLSGPPSGSTA
ncbi:MAG: hypothetical protein IJK02_05100 [Clostridia bacterium]|nr:hypothetical protein [Clostridia bacterium]